MSVFTRNHNRLGGVRQINEAPSLARDRHKGKTTGHEGEVQHQAPAGKETAAKETAAPQEQPAAGGKKPQTFGAAPKDDTKKVDQFSGARARKKWEAMKEIPVYPAVFNAIKKTMGFQRVDKGMVMLDELSVKDIGRRDVKLSPGDVMVPGGASAVKLFSKTAVISNGADVDPGDIEKATEEREYIFVEDLKYEIDKEIGERFTRRKKAVIDPYPKGRDFEIRNDMLSGAVDIAKEDDQVRSQLLTIMEMRDDPERIKKDLASLYPGYEKLTVFGLPIDDWGEDQVLAAGIIVLWADGKNKGNDFSKRLVTRLFQGADEDEYEVVSSIFKLFERYVVFPDEAKDGPVFAAMKGTKAERSRKVLILIQDLQARVDGKAQVFPAGEDVSMKYTDKPGNINAFIKANPHINEDLKLGKDLSVVFAPQIEELAAADTTVAVETQFRVVWHFVGGVGAFKTVDPLSLSEKDVKQIETHSKELPFKQDTSGDSAVMSAMQKSIAGLTKIANGAGMVGFIDLAWEKAKGKAGGAEA